MKPRRNLISSTVPLPVGLPRISTPGGIWSRPYVSSPDEPGSSVRNIRQLPCLRPGVANGGSSFLLVERWSEQRRSRMWLLIAALAQGAITGARAASRSHSILPVRARTWSALLRGPHDRAQAGIVAPLRSAGDESSFDRSTAWRSRMRATATSSPRSATTTRAASRRRRSCSAQAKECGAHAVKLQKRDNRALYTRAMYDKPYDNENSFGATYGEHRESLEFGRDEYLELQALRRASSASTSSPPPSTCRAPTSSPSSTCRPTRSPRAISRTRRC